MTIGIVFIKCGSLYRFFQKGRIFRPVLFARAAHMTGPSRSAPARRLPWKRRLKRECRQTETPNLPLLFFAFFIAEIEILVKQRLVFKIFVIDERRIGVEVVEGILHVGEFIAVQAVNIVVVSLIEIVVIVEIVLGFAAFFWT